MIQGSHLYMEIWRIWEKCSCFMEKTNFSGRTELFAQKVEKSSGSKIQAFMGQNMYHDYLMMVSFPESVKAFETIQTFLKK